MLLVFSLKLFFDRNVLLPPVSEAEVKLAY